MKRSFKPYTLAQKLPALLFVGLGFFAIGSPTYADSQFNKLDEAAGPEAKQWAVIFDFDSDSCLSSPAISSTGVQNAGLKNSGPITGQCRESGQLDNSNTYYRKQCIEQDESSYCVHMYALYFLKDQVVAGADAFGHRNDWEFALVWVKNGVLTHASYSSHGNVTTTSKANLYFDAGAENNVKIVYHKDGGSTHAFRFAKKDEKAENPEKKWVTPTLVDWYEMKGDGNITNAALRQQLNTYDYGKANCSFNDKNFPKEIGKNPPSGYPKGSQWTAEALAGIANQ
jgi:hypothetical protein